MRIDILTLFPEEFEGVIGSSIIKRAVEGHQVEIYVHDYREYSSKKSKRVDDYSYGGGAGMIIEPQPIVDCLKNIPNYDKALKLITNPIGKTFNQKKAENLAKLDHIIIVCGHYEGIDQRVLDEIVDEEISIGDYVLTGGEIPAMVLIDSVSRYVDGVITKESVEEESFANGLLEYPQYTRPEIFLDRKVPEVLVSRKS